jgi:hypothetical protein
MIKAKCTFAINKSYGIHPHEGIPQLYFDQLNIIAKHLSDITKEQKQPTGTIRTNQVSTPTDQETSQEVPIPKSFKLSE